MVWYCAGSQRAETLFLMILHVASYVQTFFLASLDFGFGSSICIPLWSGLGLEGGTRAPPKVIGVLPQRSSAEASQYHVMVRVMPWVPDRNIPEETKIFPQDVICTGP